MEVDYRDGMLAMLKLNLGHEGLLNLILKIYFLNFFNLRTQVVLHNSQARINKRGCN